MIVLIFQEVHHQDVIGDALEWNGGQFKFENQIINHRKSTYPSIE